MHIFIRNPTIGKSSLSQNNNNNNNNKSTTVTSSDGEIPAQKYRPVLKKFSGASNWPQQSVILPGNEVMFSLETASDYVKDDKVSIKDLYNYEIFYRRYPNRGK